MGKHQVVILKKVLLCVKRFWLGLAASLFLSGIYVVLSLYIPILVGNAIDCILEVGRVDFTAMSQILTNVAIGAIKVVQAFATSRNPWSSLMISTNV